MEAVARYEKRKRSTITQVLMAVTANLSSLASGIAIGFSGIAIPSLTSKSFQLDISQVSWIASVIYLTNPIGCFVSGLIADKLGRKVALISNDLISFTGWLLIISAYYTPGYSYTLLLLGRLITGISTGMVAMTPSVYIAEISTSNLRAMLTTWTSIFVSFGVLLCYILGLSFDGNWGIIAIITATFPIASVTITLIYLPESYVWLVSQCKIEQARRSMKKVFGDSGLRSEMVEEEINVLLVEKDKNKNVLQRKASYRQLLDKTCAIPMLLIVSYLFFLNFSGAFIIIGYALNFVSSMKISVNPYIIICSVAAIRLLGAIFLGYVSKLFGRRSLSIASGSGMTVCMLGLSLYLVLVTKYNILDSQYSSWIPILLLIIYFFICTVGFITIPYAMAAEVFPLDIRGIATGLAACSGCFFSFVALKIYPFLVLVSGDNYHLLLLFYGTITFVGTVFVYLFLPETKGKSLEEIQQYFKTKRNFIV